MLPDIVYIEFNGCGDPQLLIQHQEDGLRVYAVLGENIAPVSEATRPQTSFVLRLIEEVGDNADFEAGGSSVWYDRTQIHVHHARHRLPEKPDLAVFWSRARMEQNATEGHSSSA